jgi:hypothetical protein
VGHSGGPFPRFEKVAVYKQKVFGLGVLKNAAEEFVGSVLDLRPKISRPLCCALFFKCLRFTFVLSLQGNGEG